MRSAAHIVEDLCFEVDFTSEDEAFEAQERVTRFAQKRAQEVIAEVFDEVIGPDAVLRLEKLAIDVGTIRMEEFEERFAERLRKELMRLLTERREALNPRAGVEMSAQLGQDALREPALPSGWDVGQNSVARFSGDVEQELPPQSRWDKERKLALQSNRAAEQGSAAQSSQGVERQSIVLSNSDFVPAPSPTRPTFAVAERNAVAYRPAAGVLYELFHQPTEAVDSLTTGAGAELGWLLHFLDHGFLPWHAPGDLGREVQALAARVLKGNGVQLARALLGAPAAQFRVIFRRLAAQFSAPWLTQVGREIRLVRRADSEALWRRPIVSGPAGVAVTSLTDSVAHVTTPSTSDTASRPTAQVAGAAVVSSASKPAGANSSLTHSVLADDLQEDLARSRARAQIETALGEPAESDFGLLPVVPAIPLAPAALNTWRSVLSTDAGWLKETLERMGRRIRVRRRLVAVLSEDVLKDLLGLWLSPAQVDGVWALDAAETERLPNRRDNYRTEPAPSAIEIGRSNPPPDALRARRFLAALNYILVGGGAERFTEDEYRLSLARLNAEEVCTTASALTQTDRGIPRGGLTPSPVLGRRSSVDPARKPGTQTELSRTSASSSTDTVHVDAIGRAAVSECPFPADAERPNSYPTGTPAVGPQDSFGPRGVPEVGSQDSFGPRGVPAVGPEDIFDPRGLPAVGPEDSFDPRGLPAVGPEDRSGLPGLPAVGPEDRSGLPGLPAVGPEDRSGLPGLPAVSSQDSFGPPGMTVTGRQVNSIQSGADVVARRDNFRTTGAANVGLQNPVGTHVDKVRTPEAALPKIVRGTDVVDSDNLHEELSRSRARAWIEAVLSETLEPDPKLEGVESDAVDIWRRVLRDDSAWISSTLLHLGRAVRVRRRVAAILPEEVVEDLLSLWLPPDQLQAVIASVSHETACPPGELANTSVPQENISAAWLLDTLTYLLVEGGALEFSEADYRRSLARRLPNRAGAESDGPEALRHRSAGLRHGSGGPRHTPHEMRYTEDARSPENRATEALNVGRRSGADVADGPVQGRDDAGSEQDSLHHVRLDPASLKALRSSRTQSGPQRVHQQNPTHAIQPDSAPAQTQALAVPPATDAVTSDVELFRHLRGRASSNLSTHDLRQALRTLLVRRPAAARYELLSALEYPGAGRRLTALVAGGDLPELLKWLRPVDGEQAIACAARVARLIDKASRPAVRRQADAGEVSSTGEVGSDSEPDINTDEAAATRAVNAFVVTELFEEGRAFDPEPFAKRLAAALDAKGPSSPLANLGGVLGTNGAPAQTPALAGRSPRSTETHTSLPPGPKCPERVLSRRLREAADSACRSNSSAGWRTYAEVSPSRARPAAPMEDAALHQRIYITNAGVVLVGAYLPRLFSMLELTNEAEFTSARHAHRAVHLIQYIVTGATTTPEPILVLNKILCGLPISEPVPLDIDLRAKERAAIEEMLAAIIAHWKAIGRTSVAGLRESFLQRGGRLVSADDSWQLRVETKSFDLLLDRLPWGYTTVKFPWMKRMLRVEWR